MRAKPGDEPVVMLNLLRYRDAALSGAGVDGLSGQDAYRQYGQAFTKLGPRFGGEPIWMGAGGESIVGDDQWDVVILVRYPTRAKFVEMLTDPGYLAIAPMRAAALEDSRLLEMRELMSA